MALRDIIEIDEELCDGCGACSAGCPEGALQIIEGKARLVGESLCDGLGACIGDCPRGAIRVTRREAEDYDEPRVMEGIARHGAATIAAHLSHLRNHGQDSYLRQAEGWLTRRGIALPAAAGEAPATEEGCACGGGTVTAGRPIAGGGGTVTAGSPVSGSASALAAWPIQLHLVNPRAPQFAGADLLVAADCTAFALASFHAELLAGRSLVIACPKLDQGRDIYLDKLATLVSGAASVTVAIMEVPCCSGLLKLVLEASERLASSGLPGTPGPGKAPRVIVVGVKGGIREEGTVPSNLRRALPSSSRGLVRHGTEEAGRLPPL